MPCDGGRLCIARVPTGEGRGGLRRAGVQLAGAGRRRQQRVSAEKQGEMSAEEPIVAWMNTFPTVTVAVGDLMDLKDGVALLEAFSEIDTMVDVDGIKRGVRTLLNLLCAAISLCVAVLCCCYG